MTNCSDIIFGQAVTQSHENMQQQERANEILITDYVVNILSCEPFVFNAFFLQSKIKPAAVVSFFLPNNFVK